MQRTSRTSLRLALGALITLTAATASAAPTITPSDFARFLGLRYGAGAWEVNDKFPDTIKDHSGDSTIIRCAMTPFDPGESPGPTFDVWIDDKTGLVDSLWVDLDVRLDLTWGANEEDKAKLALLGQPASAVVAALGPASDSDGKSLTWTWQSPESSGSVNFGCDGAAKTCDRMTIHWSHDTLEAPKHVKAKSFARFAGLARGADRAQVERVLGPPESVTEDKDRRGVALHYAGGALDVRVASRTNLVAGISAHGPEAHRWLEARDIDEPNLWPIGRSPAAVRGILGKPASDDSDLLEWTWSGRGLKEGGVDVICGGFASNCQQVHVTWIPSPPPLTLKKVAITRFETVAGIHRGDKLPALVALFGEPEKSTDSDRLIFYSFAGGDLVVATKKDTGAVSLITFKGADVIAWLAARGVRDPKLALLGHSRRTLRGVLGRPQSEDEYELAWQDRADTVQVHAECPDENCSDITIYY